MSLYKIINLAFLSLFLKTKYHISSTKSLEFFIKSLASLGKIKKRTGEEQKTKTTIKIDSINNKKDVRATASLVSQKIIYRQSDNDKDERTAENSPRYINKINEEINDLLLGIESDPRKSEERIEGTNYKKFRK